MLGAQQAMKKEQARQHKQQAAARERGKERERRRSVTSAVDHGDAPVVSPAGAGVIGSKQAHDLEARLAANDARATHTRNRGANQNKVHPEGDSGDAPKRRCSCSRSCTHRYLFKETIAAGTPLKLGWDGFVCAIILYSVIIVPYRIGFSVDADGWVLVFDYIVDAFFFLDIVVNFLAQYTDGEGLAVTSRRRIAWNYLTHWFVIDLLSTIPVDLFVAIFGAGTTAKSFKLLRVLRLARLLKLVRLIKLAKLFDNMEELQDMLMFNPALVRLFKLLAQIMFMGHVLACFWYWVSSLEVTRNSWICGSGDRGGAVLTDLCPNGEDAGRQTQYLTALYWTIATMTTVGYGDVVAGTSNERLYSIFTMLVGASVFGFIIGNISSLLGTMDARQAAYKQKMDEVKEYLRDRQFPASLSKRVIKYFEYFMDRKSIFDEQVILSELSNNLRNQVVRQSNQDTISKVKFLDKQDTGFVTGVVTRMKPLFAVSGEILCAEDDVGKEMYFLVKGHVQASVCGVDEHDMEKRYTIGVHSEGAHFGEVALLMNKQRPMTLEAVDHCDTFSLSKEDLESTLFHFPTTRALMLKMCTEKLERLLQARRSIEAAVKRRAKYKVKRKAKDAARAKSVTAALAGIGKPVDTSGIEDMKQTPGGDRPKHVYGGHIRLTKPATHPQLMMMAFGGKQDTDHPVTPDDESPPAVVLPSSSDLSVPVVAGGRSSIVKAAEKPLIPGGGVETKRGESDSKSSPGSGDTASTDASAGASASATAGVSKSGAQSSTPGAAGAAKSAFDMSALRRVQEGEPEEEDLETAKAAVEESFASKLLGFDSATDLPVTLPQPKLGHSASGEYKKPSHVPGGSAFQISMNSASRRHISHRPAPAPRLRRQPSSGGGLGARGARGARGGGFRGSSRNLQIGGGLRGAGMGTSMRSLDSPHLRATPSPTIPEEGKADFSSLLQASVREGIPEPEDTSEQDKANAAIIEKALGELPDLLDAPYVFVDEVMHPVEDVVEDWLTPMTVLEMAQLLDPSSMDAAFQAAPTVLAVASPAPSGLSILSSNSSKRKAKERQAMRGKLKAAAPQGQAVPDTVRVRRASLNAAKAVTRMQAAAAAAAKEMEDGLLGSKRASDMGTTIGAKAALYARGGAASIQTKRNKQQVMPWHVVHPNSRGKFVWDVSVAILIMYSVVIIPFRIGFGVDAEGTVRVLDYLVDVIFFVDMAVNFRTAFRDGYKDSYIVDAKAIAIHYLKHWFTIDLLSTVPVDLIVELSAGAGGDATAFRGLKLFRVLRLIRLLKLARLAKLNKFIVVLEDQFHLSPAALRLCKLFFEVMFIAHLMCCFFFFASTFDEDSTKNWIDNYFGITYSPTLTEVYLASIYYAYSTMTTVGYGDVVAKNDSEILYSIFCMIIGATVFGYIVGSMASIVGRLNYGDARYKEKMDEITDYMRERDLTPSLRRKVRKYYEYYLSRKSAFDENTILSELSDNLKRDAIMHLNKDIITQIPFFEAQSKGFISFVMSIMYPMFTVPKDFIFQEGEIGLEMYFLVKGRVEVLKNANTEDEVVLRELEKGSFFGEIAILCATKRTASIRAVTYCNLFTLMKDDLDVMIMHYPTLASMMQQSIKKKLEAMWAESAAKKKFRKAGSRVAMLARGGLMAKLSASKQAAGEEEGDHEAVDVTDAHVDDGLHPDMLDGHAYFTKGSNEESGPSTKALDKDLGAALLTRVSQDDAVVKQRRPSLSSPTKQRRASIGTPKQRRPSRPFA